MNQEIMEQGFDLMLYGMGTVVVFLTLLVLATSIMSRVASLFPEAVPPLPEKPAGTSASGPEDRIKRVIALAIEQHRNKQGR